MSRSVVPGWAAMKYGIRYCFLPAFSDASLNKRLNFSKLAIPGLSIFESGPSSVCSGAIFR